MPATRAALADPTRLKPIDKDKLLQVIIETPRGCRNKLAFDPAQRIFALKAVMPAGMAFPYDFGFVPRTIAPDGDPIDVLVLMDEPVFPGTLVPCRLIGVIEGEQTADGKTNRNDRLIAVANVTHQYNGIKKMSDLPKGMLKELGDFFVNYHRTMGKKFKVLGTFDAPTAWKLIKKSRKK